MTPAWAARLAHLIPAHAGQSLVIQLEAHREQRYPGQIRVELDCGPDGVCRGGRVIILIDGRAVTVTT